MDGNRDILIAQWKKHGLVIGLMLLLLGIFYYPTFESIVEIWLRSDTFAHGFIIAPISLWLIWRVREQLLSTEPSINFLGLPFLLLLGITWLLAVYIDVLAIEQLAAVMMIPVVAFTLVGWQATSIILFPLFFLLFSVPLGEELTPVLIEFTADFTVAMVKLVGIPVYREGNFLQLPTGNWSVVSACSGVRYLIASVTLGLLYAYLTYQSMLKRGLFIVASAVVPIIANGLRAFIIVMLGHLSDMKLATGVDHLIYGWFFFGIVIAIMFYIGSFWREETEEENQRNLTLSVGNVSFSSVVSKITLMSVCAIIIMWPVKASVERENHNLGIAPEIELVSPVGWEKTGEKFLWKPDFRGLDQEFDNVYRNQEGKTAGVFIGYYTEQRQGSEVGNYNNVLVGEANKKWRVVERYKDNLQLIDNSIRAPFAVISSRDENLLTAYLYYVDGKFITHKYLTKLMQAKAKIFGGRNDGAAIFITVPYADNDNTEKLLKGFSSVLLPNIKQSLDQLKN
ncbi:MAG: exosortase A [Sedimenticola sp.]